MVVSTQKIGIKRKPEHITPRPKCGQCQKAKYKRDFRRKNGQISQFCRDCRRQNTKKVQAKDLSFEQLRIGIFSILKAKISKKEVKTMASSKAQTYADKLTKMPIKIATILGKTFVVRGDDASLSDDEALIRIRDLIEDFDPKLIANCKNKRLP